MEGSLPLVKDGIESTVEEVQLLLEDRNQMLDEFQFQLDKIRNKMKQSADKKMRVSSV